MPENRTATADIAPDIQIPATPHMPPEAVEKLTELLEMSSCFLEYGAGGSTRLAGRIGVRSVYSVESDKRFLEAVGDALDKDNSSATFHPVFADIGPTREWGNPIDNSGVRRWPDYPLGVWDLLRTHQVMPDLILVDGRFRLACTLASLLHAPAGTLIMIDDYIKRERHYQPFTRYAKIKQVVTRCAIIEVPERIDYRSLAVDLARACTQTR